MKDDIIRAFEILEIQRKDLLASLEGLSDEQLAYKPSSDQWSILQVLAHLVKGEVLSLKYMKRKFGDKENLPAAGLSSTLRYFVMKLALHLPLKFKSSKMTDTSGHSPVFETVMGEWEGVRAELEEFIGMCDEETLAKTIYKHPRAGDLNAEQAIGFMSMHISHHEKQIERLIQVVKRL